MIIHQISILVFMLIIVYRMLCQLYEIQILQLQMFQRQRIIDALGGGISYTVQFPLRLIQNTAFAVDKNMYFGQTTYLKCYFGSLNKICYSSTSNANPSAGVKTSYIPAAGTNASIGPISGTAVFVAPTVAVNFQLY